MAVLGIDIRKISFEKIKAPTPQVEVDLTPRINELRLGELRTPTGKVNGIEVLFEYTVNYKPDIAKASIEGRVFYLPRNKGDVDKILDVWESEKRVDPYLFAEAVNAITNEIMPTLLNLSKRLQLPYPIPIPRVNVGVKGE
ncbi:MAG: hypothetical protein J7K57_05170 [Palaeococcus sp.]|uniref:hypothetical protein n=1 Tax=Palaeococcus sp. (in: euryarchaeotes) TaxID=2820298 RepID=UPI0025D54ECE|nr:hypothetical protein [Palaeococcus sp. (in: euryarchaeotes)]MCD6559245.1 hypothetical protein [Palaeococcus sp. (in: euryarchaeotes)]